MRLCINVDDEARTHGTRTSDMHTSSFRVKKDSIRMKIEKKSFSRIISAFLFGWSCCWLRQMGTYIHIIQVTKAHAKDGFISLEFNQCCAVLLQVLNYLLVDTFPLGTKE